MANVPGEKMVIFDIARCRVSIDTTGSVATLFAPSGELLAVIDVRFSWSDRETALRLYDLCLASGFVWRDEALHKVALWNPHTRTVSVDPLPDTTSFFLPKNSLPTSGLPVLVFQDRVLCQGESFHAEKADSLASLTRVLQAHKA